MRGGPPPPGRGALASLGGPPASARPQGRRPSQSWRAHGPGGTLVRSTGPRLQRPAAGSAQ
eukprot:10436746-Alexandrium_andersonii.AAC.1